MIEQKYIDTYLKGTFYKAALGKHLRVFKAFVDGFEIEYVGCDGEWAPALAPTFHEDGEYRVKPQQPQPLDIPWKYIDKGWNYAAMDKDGSVWFYQNHPVRANAYWYHFIRLDSAELLNVDTSHVTDWELSLTERPEGV